MEDFPASPPEEKPKEIGLYIDAIKRKKAAEAEEKKYRPKVLSFCKQFGSLPELEYSSYTKTEWHDDKILAWIKSSYSGEIASAVTKEALDMEAFELLVKKGQIDINQMPDDCTTETPVDKLQTVKETK